MFKISDILKKYKDGKAGAGQNEADDPRNHRQGRQEDRMMVSTSINKEQESMNAAKAKALYEEALLEVKEIYRADLGYGPDFQFDVDEVVAKIVEQASSETQELLRLCLANYEKSEDYFYCHVINVTIISIDIGLGLGYDQARSLELGIAAFVHDIGIIQYLNIINKKGILSKDEFQQVKEHPQRGVDVLNKIGKELNRAIIDAVYQEHERLDGSGYPRSLKEGQINEYARIIGVADVYEAMIHHRPYRTKYTPFETIKSILNNKNVFDGRIVKSLIERIGIFPLGILVRLNTKEIGVVDKENTKLPLRPVVKIISDSSGKELKEPRLIDLSRNPVIFIEECMECVKGS